jgi:hypothetical protein
MRVLKAKGKTLDKFVPILDHVLRCTTENVFFVLSSTSILTASP